MMCMCTITGVLTYNTIRNFQAHTDSHCGIVTEKMVRNRYALTLLKLLATSAKSGLHVGNMKFNTHNEK
jgi:hypothetical protein